MYSSDNGTSWTKSKPSSTNGATLRGSEWCSFSGTEDGVIIAGSGMSSTDPWANTGIGIIRSTDWGRTWSKTSLTTGLFGSIAYMGNNVFVASCEHSDLGVAGIWRSEDGGLTWKRNENPSGNYPMPLIERNKYADGYVPGNDET